MTTATSVASVMEIMLCKSISPPQPFSLITAPHFRCINDQVYAPAKESVYSWESIYFVDIERLCYSLSYLFWVGRKFRGVNNHNLHLCFWMKLFTVKNGENIYNNIRNNNYVSHIDLRFYNFYYILKIMCICICVCVWVCVHKFWFPRCQEEA